MLCNQVALLLLFEATGNPSYLTKVEKRWSELVGRGYINPAGGILEKCQVKFSRDEGCALADWLRLNLALAKVTGKARYWAMAERTLHNHFLQNQTSKGGFGHRSVWCDDQGVHGFGGDIAEATWCCSHHGERGFIQVRQHVLSRADGMVTLPFVLDFTARDAVGTTVSMLRPGLKADEVMRQRISLAGQPAAVVRARLPHWAEAVTAVDATGAGLPATTTAGWCTTVQPVTEVEFIYRGGVYAEDRHCNRLPDGPKPGQPFVLGYGPKILAAEGRTAATPVWPITLEALKSQGVQPFRAEMRRQDCCFVFGREP
jgi:DUF1680 family protein